MDFLFSDMSIDKTNIAKIVFGISNNEYIMIINENLKTLKKLASEAGNNALKNAEESIMGTESEAHSSKDIHGKRKKSDHKNTDEKPINTENLIRKIKRELNIIEVDLVHRKELQSFDPLSNLWDLYHSSIDEIENIFIIRGINKGLINRVKMFAKNHDIIECVNKNILLLEETLMNESQVGGYNTNINYTPELLHKILHQISISYDFAYAQNQSEAELKKSIKTIPELSSITSGQYTYAMKRVESYFIENKTILEESILTGEDVRVIEKWINKRKSNHNRKEGYYQKNPKRNKTIKHLRSEKIKYTHSFLEIAKNAMLDKNYESIPTINLIMDTFYNEYPFMTFHQAQTVLEKVNAKYSLMDRKSGLYRRTLNIENERHIGLIHYEYKNLSRQVKDTEKVLEEYKLKNPDYADSQTKSIRLGYEQILDRLQTQKSKLTKTILAFQLKTLDKVDVPLWIKNHRSEVAPEHSNVKIRVGDDIQQSNHDIIDNNGIITTDWEDVSIILSTMEIENIEREILDSWECNLNCVNACR